MTQDATTANLLDPGIFPAEKGAPHALFDAWRQVDPVHWNPATPAYRPNIPGSSMTKGFWVLTRHQDVFDVSRDQDLFSSHEDGFVIWDLDAEELFRQRANFMGMLPADHQAVKQFLMPAFSARALQALAPEIDRLAKEIVDGVAARGGCEFVFDVASKLPVYTFCTLMGIPEALRERVVELGNAMADVETRGEHEVDPTFQLFAIAQEVAAQKRQSPDRSLMSLLANDPALNLSDMAINMFFIVFAIAGHETTRSTAAHFIQLMATHPDQYALLRSDVDRYLENAVEEVLRYTSTTTNFRRTVMADTDIGGTAVRKGDKVYLSYAAANRDPAKFADPHRFAITRDNARQHVAFGTGPHVCIGARLARMQLHALLKQIVTRIPDFQLDGEPVWLRSIWFNAITCLPIRFTPEVV
jgi:cytochrome P450